jgi:exonuclease VII small subunit
MTSEPTAAARLETLVDELEETAVRLRSGELDGDEAALAVERCAELASRLGSELDMQARSASADTPPGQEKLL